MPAVRRRPPRERVTEGPTAEDRARMAANRELLRRRLWAWCGPGVGTPEADLVTRATMRLRKNGWTPAGVAAELERMDREAPGWAERLA